MFDKDMIMSIITIGGSIIGAGGATTIISAMINRRKTHAEASKIELSGSLDVGRMGLEYAGRFKGDLDDMRKELKELQDKYDSLLDRFSKLQQDYNELKSHYDTSCRELERLQKELNNKEDK